MNEITPTFLLQKLKLFLTESEAQKGIEETILGCGIPIKSVYAREEIEKILNAMIVKGGYFEFVARNAKVSLILK